MNAQTKTVSADNPATSGNHTSAYINALLNRSINPAREIVSVCRAALQSDAPSVQLHAAESLRTVSDLLRQGVTELVEFAEAADQAANNASAETRELPKAHQQFFRDLAEQAFTAHSCIKTVYMALSQIPGYGSIGEPYEQVQDAAETLPLVTPTLDRINNDLQDYAWYGTIPEKSEPST